MAIYPIVFTIDKNYVMPLCVALLSLLDSNSDNNIKIYIIYDDLSDSDKARVMKCVSNYSVVLSFISINSEIFISYKTGYHFTKAIYFRLLIPEIFKYKYDKVLYIDADALIMGDLVPIFELDLEDSYLAAVDNNRFDRYESLGIEKTNGYFASGTLLFNIKKWIDDDIFLRIIKYLDGNNHIIMPDQDALNVIINGKWKRLNIRFGIETSLIDEVEKEKYFGCQEFVKDPIIVHFSGTSKPWHFRNNHKYKNKFNKYLKLTPFHPYVPDDFTLYNVLIGFIPRSVRIYIRKVLNLE